MSNSNRTQSESKRYAGHEDGTLVGSMWSSEKKRGCDSLSRNVNMGKALATKKEANKTVYDFISKF